tara:strand:- start:1000 stop:2109 length:1110 start_codon:yes stop_codon:yes gene_type:complete
MKVFQAHVLGQHYLKYFNKKVNAQINTSFLERKQALLDDRHCSSHILKPMYENDPQSNLVIADDEISQMAWAKEHSLKTNSLNEILISQVEDFQPDVFYITDPTQFSSAFVKRLPSGVKIKIAFYASLIEDVLVNDISEYDLIVSNFETLNAELTKKIGIKTLWFAPSWDPEMKSYADNLERPTDLFFSGSYRKIAGYDERLEVLNTIAGNSDKHLVDICLMTRPFSRYGSRGILRWIPVPTAIPRNIKEIKSPPVYGRDMLEKQSRAKIVINPATDIAGLIRGNMRCWEAMGCGACMLGTEGLYPEGFIAGENFETFNSIADLKMKIDSLLSDNDRRLDIANKGKEMISKVWSKERQWIDFQKIVSES